MLQLRIHPSAQASGHLLERVSTLKPARYLYEIHRTDALKYRGHGFSIRGDSWRFKPDVYSSLYSKLLGYFENSMVGVCMF